MKKMMFIPMLVLVFIMLNAFADDKPSKEKELSYKTGKSEPRYLSKFNEQAVVLPEDYSVDIPDIEAKCEKILELLNAAANSATRFDWFKAIEDENVFFTITDLGNARFTLKVNNGSFSVQEGIDTTETPTMVVPLDTKNVENLAAFLADGQLTYEEKYRIFYFITIPGLQTIYRNEILYKPGDKSAFRFDNLVHVVIPPEEDVLIYGNRLLIEATVVNVDGQWMVFRGLQGDPDFRVNLTIDQAAKLYQLAFYEVRKIKNPQQAKEVSEKFLAFLDTIVEYTRADHMQE
jgi:hypothetical protein